MKEKSRICLPSANNPWTLLHSLLKQKVTKSKTHRHLLLSILALFGSLFLSTGASYAGEGYVGAWREGSDNYAVYGYDSWDRFTEKWEELGKGNFLENCSKLMRFSKKNLSTKY